METRRIKAAEVQESRFYQLPKWLIQEHQFKSLGSDAKILYAILRDRNDLSIKNKWVDDKGEVYMICTRIEMCELLGASDKTVTKAVKDLVKHKLIEEVRQGCNKPNLIYLMTVSFDSQWTRNISESKNVNIPYPNTEILRANDTDINKTDINKTDKKSSSNSAPAAALENFYFDCFDKKPVQTVKTKISEYLKVMDAECIKLAMEKSVGHSWGYCLAILKAWAELGVKTLSDVELKDSKANTKQQQQNAPQGELVSKNPQFTRTYSHNWDLDALDELASGDLDRQLEKWNGLDVTKDDEGYDQIKFK